MDAEEKLIEEIAKSDSTLLQNAFLLFQEEKINKSMRFAETLEKIIKASKKSEYNYLNAIVIFKGIAQFMEWPQLQNKLDEIYYQIPNLYPVSSYNSEYTVINIKDFEFNFNWNWLMPVIEKISKTVENGKYVYPTTFGMMGDNFLFMFRFNGYLLHSSEKLIDAAFNAVGEYLQVNGFIKD
jgi:hypothetical protein